MNSPAKRLKTRFPSERTGRGIIVFFRERGKRKFWGAGRVCGKARCCSRGRISASWGYRTQYPHLKSGGLMRASFSFPKAAGTPPPFIERGVPPPHQADRLLSRGAWGECAGRRVAVPGELVERPFGQRENWCDRGAGSRIKSARGALRGLPHRIPSIGKSFAQFGEKLLFI